MKKTDSGCSGLFFPQYLFSNPPSECDPALCLGKDGKKKIIPLILRLIKGQSGYWPW